MKKAIKIVLGILLALVLIVVVAIMALIFLVSPNQFKPQIIKVAQNSLHRQVTIPGDLHWSFYPNIGISTGKIVIANPEQFKQRTFAQINSAQAQVALMPLLSGHVQAKTIQVKGLQLNLIQKSDKVNNWTFAGSKGESTQEKASKSGSKQPKPQSLNDRKANINIDTIMVSNGSVSFVNQQTGQKMQIDNLQLSAKQVQFGHPFTVDLSFNAQGNQPKWQAQSHMQARLNMGLDQEVFSLQQLHFTTNYQSQDKKEQKPTKIKVNLRGQATADLRQETIKLAPKITINNLMTVRGDVKVEHLLTEPLYQGKLTVEPFAIKKLLQSLNQAVPSMPSKKALSKADAKLQFNGTSNKIKVSQLAATFDESHINGQLALANFTAPTFTTDLHLDAIDLSHYVQLHGATMPISQVNAKAKLQADGMSAEQIPNSLKGNISATVNRTVLHGIDLHAAINEAGVALRDVLKGQDPSRSLQLLRQQLPAKGASIDANSGKNTDLGKFTGAAEVRGGVLTTKVFKLKGPSVLVDGTGSINLNSANIDMMFDVSKSKSDDEQAQDQQVSFKLPVKMSGPISEPEVQLQWQQINKRFVNYASNAVKQSVTKNIHEKAGQLVQGLFKR